MTDIAPVPEDHPTRTADNDEGDHPDRSEGVAKWGILAATILGLAGLAILHFRGGSVDLRWKDSGLSYNVNSPSPTPDDGPTDAGPSEVTHPDR